MDSRGHSNLIPVTWLASRQIKRNLTVDWDDGPVSGVLLLDNPDEELGFIAIARRNNPEGVDFRLARAWPVPMGTMDRIERMPQLTIGGTGVHRAIVQTTDFD